jgi:membrane protein implicated in regulation of membrane protease activity
VTGWLWTAGFTAIAIAHVIAASRGKVAVSVMLLLAGAVYLVANAAWNVARGDLVGAGLNVMSAVLWWWWWRRNGKGRDRAAKLIGAKARALRDRLVARQREAAQPAGGAR